MPLSGTIDSQTSSLTKVTANVQNYDGVCDVSATPNNKSYSLGSLTLKTASLPAGTYTIRIWGTNSANNGILVTTATLTVKAVSDNITSSSVPSNFTVDQGNDLPLSGTINSQTSSLTKVTANVQNYDGVCDVSASPNNKSYSLSSLTLKTASLLAGTYTIRIWGTNSANNGVLVTTATLTVEAVSDNITSSSVPSSFTVDQGNDLPLSGTIDSQTSSLTKVTANVQNYDGVCDVSATPNNKSYSLSSLTLKTASLPAGTYTIRIWGTNSANNGVLVTTATLTVKPLPTYQD